MLRLYVMRHAKSSWAVPGARDFDRELNERGIFDLEKMRQTLKARGFIPEKIICSPAIRTIQTFEHIKESLPENTTVNYEKRLYSSGLSEYLNLIQEVEDARTLMLIGHNPMCGALAASLPRPDSDFPVDTIAYKYPTATVAVIEFDCANWSDIERGKGNLIDCLIPSKL